MGECHVIDLLLSLVISQPDMVQANAGALLGLLALGQVGVGVGGLFAGRKQADFQEELAAVAVDDRRREAKRLLARQRVAFAKGGVDIGTGTPVDVQAVTAGEEELSALRAGFPFQVRGERFRTEGRNALARGLFSASSTLVSNPNTLGSIFSRKP